MTTTNIGLTAIAFAAGILFAQTWNATKRRHQHATWTRVHTQWLDSIPTRPLNTEPHPAPVERREPTPHVCSFGANCSHARREAERQATRDRLR